MVEVIPTAASTQIQSVVYDDETMELTIWFRRGGVYQYFQVPGDVVSGFRQALSAGRYFMQFVKDSFDYEKIG